jgi:hypothetical protein
MKKYILLLLLPLASCQVLEFDRYPGTAVEKFPQEMVGAYRNVEGLSTSDDTLFFTITEKSIEAKSQKETHGSELDSNHVLSKYDNQYYYFIKQEGTWSGFALDKRKNKLLVTPFLIPYGAEDSVRNLKVLSGYFKNVKCMRIDSFNSNYQMAMDEKELQRYARKMKRNRIICTQIKSNE